MSYIVLGITIIYMLFHIISMLRTKSKVLNNKKMNDAFIGVIHSQGGSLDVEASNPTQ